MKLQKQISRKIDDKTYAKWVITIPPTEIKKLGWTDGEDLELKVLKGRIEIASKNKT